MALMIVCFLLGALAMGVLALPFIKRSGQAASPPAATEGAPKSDAPPAGGAPTILGYPRNLVLAGGGGVVVLIAAVAVYFATNEPQTPNPSVGAVPPGAATTGAGAGAPSLPPVDTMIEQLAKRLEAKPNDPDGWRMLGWSYFATQKYADAVKAYARAVAERPGDAGFQSAYGEALVKANGDKVTPEAQAAFRKALAADSQDERARIYMARLKHEKGDSKGALTDLFAILNASQPDSKAIPIAKDAIRKVSAESGISVADRLPPEPAGPTAADVQSAQQMPASDQQAMVEGMVSKLEARLAASPRDADGWIMLVRSRKKMGQDAQAKAALTKGLAVFADDAAARSRITEAARDLGVQ